MLKIENLHASVEDKSILQGINLEVKPGEVHAIMGPNGSGKSTLASVIAGKEDYEVTNGKIEFNGEDNHIHLLFQYYPQMQLPKFIGNIKSVTSRKLRQEFPEQVNKVYWKKVFWNESYFIASCGGVTISVLKKYIENQDTPS